jgi:hypothetical protein
MKTRKKQMTNGIILGKSNDYFMLKLVEKDCVYSENEHTK